MIERGFEIRKGLNVLDRDGEKIGTIRELFRPNTEQYELADLIMHVESGFSVLGPTSTYQVVR